MRYEYAYLLWMAQKYKAALWQLKLCIKPALIEKPKKGSADDTERPVPQNIEVGE